MTSFSCRLAGGDDLRAANILLASNYAVKGYGKHSIPTGPGHTTLVAEVDGRIVATVTLVIDGGIARLIRLASSARSADLLAALFDLALQHGTATSQAHDLYIEVSPHHAGFYAQRFGFQREGEPHIHESVGVEAQLMRIRVATLRAPLDDFAS